MAAADSEKAASRAADGPVFFDRRDEILAAGRCKTTTVSQQRAECVLVNVDQHNQQPAGQSHDRRKQKSHFFTPWIGKLGIAYLTATLAKSTRIRVSVFIFACNHYRLSVFLASRAASDISESVIASSDG